jgi:hypothetical protein
VFGRLYLAALAAQPHLKTVFGLFLCTTIAAVTQDIIFVTLVADYPPLHSFRAKGGGW